MKAERSLLHHQSKGNKQKVHALLRQHASDITRVKVKTLNQEHKAQRKGGRLFRTYSSEKKQVRPREERIDGPFKKKRKEGEMDGANKTNLNVGEGRSAWDSPPERQASVSVPFFFYKKNSPCSPLSPGFPCPPYARRSGEERGEQSNRHVLDAHALFPACFPDVRLIR